MRVLSNFVMLVAFVFVCLRREVFGCFCARACSHVSLRVLVCGLVCATHVTSFCMHCFVEGSRRCLCVCVCGRVCVLKGKQRYDRVISGAKFAE